jgi:hypothetical protein
VQLLARSSGVDLRAALHRRSISPSPRCEAHQPTENVMNFLASRTAATRLNAGGMMRRYLPTVSALLYPLAPLALYQSTQQFALASDMTGKLATGILLGIATALVYSVPALSLAVILKSDDIEDRRFAHLAFAAPPLFVLIGVFFYMLNVPNGDYAFWAIVWLGVLGFAAFGSPTNETPAAAPRWLRTAHGFSAAAIVVIFLAWHFANHMTAAWSLEENKKIMDLLRVWYRSDIVQPILVALLAFQLLSGLRLLWAAIARRTADIYSSIQTATAAYVAVYVTSHLIAVFILGRVFLGIDTTFEWASGAPTGLLHDPWNVRLIPHYSLAPLFVISHLAMGLRAVLLGHGVRAAFANRLAWVICGIGLGVSLVIAIAQLSVRT